MIPKTISDYLPTMLANNAPANSQNTSPETSPRRRAVIRLINRIRTGAQLLATYNPDRQDEMIHRTDIDHPSIVTVSQAYGFEIAKSWIVIQLSNLSDKAAAREKLSIPQMEDMARIIIRRYAYLKLTELMQFFQNFKAGDYGEFYGAVDPIKIMASLKRYLVERNMAIARQESQSKRREQLTDPDYIRYRRRYAADLYRHRFYAINFRSTDFTVSDFLEIFWLFNLGYERKDHGYTEPY
jgi:hypothetical protein